MMKPENRRKSAEEWLRYARSDLHAAQHLLGEVSVLPGVPCFLAQQAAEKAMKAALVLLGIEFPRTHDLPLLRTLLPEQLLFRVSNDELEKLTEWAVEARYPADIPPASRKDAATAIENAKKVLEDVLKAFEEHDIGPSGEKEDPSGKEEDQP